MATKHAVVFGGSSGIGEATAAALKRAGAEVTIAARDPGRLEAAAQRIGGARTIACDARDAAALRQAFERLGVVDQLVICVSGGKGAGAFATLDLDDVRGALEEKLLAQLRIAQAALPSLAADASITFVSAASASSVIKGTAGLAAVNGALEAVVPILAHELAPRRVNAVSPGIVDTPWWNGMPKEAKDAFFRTAEATLPVRRVGRAGEVGELVALVAASGFVTGSVYTIDGGSHLVTQ
jgi:NAD(P)-dependent dehydrogenase (short-subunit alcohol dehydrogenase family)